MREQLYIYIYNIRLGWLAGSSDGWVDHWLLSCRDILSILRAVIVVVVVVVVAVVGSSRSSRSSSNSSSSSSSSSCCQ